MFWEFLGMIFFIFVQNVVFHVIPHFRDFRGNSAMRKIQDFTLYTYNVEAITQYKSE